MVSSLGHKQFIWCLALAAGCLSGGESRSQSASSSAPAPWAPLLSRPMPPLAGEVGRALPWSNTVKPDARGKVSAAQAHAWEKQLRAVADFMATAPVLAQPRGFFPEMHGFVNWLDMGPYLDAPTRSPLVGGVTMMPWQPEQIVTGKDGLPKFKPGVEDIHGLRLELNYIYPPAKSVWMHDGAGEFGVLDVQGHYAGFPLIANALVITRDGHLPYVPVSQERALKAFLAHYAVEAKRVDEEASQSRRKYELYMAPAEQAKRRAAIEAELAKIDPSNRPAQRRYLEMWERTDGEKLLKLSSPDIENDARYGVLRAVRAAQAQLAAMSPEQRSRPAWLRRGDFPTSVPLVEPDQGVALVAIDGHFFDPKQPRDTLRVALLRQLHHQVEGANATERNLVTRSAQICVTTLQQLDWQRFAERFLRGSD